MEKPSWHERPKVNRQIVDKEGTTVFREFSDKIVRDKDGRVLRNDKEGVDIDLRESQDTDPAIAVGEPPELPPIDASELVEEERDLHAEKTQILDEKAFHAAKTLFKPGPKLASLAEDGDLHDQKTHFLDRIGTGSERDNKTAFINIKAQKKPGASKGN